MKLATKGPWLVEHQKPGKSKSRKYHNIDVVSEEGCIVAVINVCREPFPLGTGLANARLIAAAPIMLEALKLIANDAAPEGAGQSVLDERHFDLVIRAIQKAEGPKR